MIGWMVIPTLIFMWWYIGRIVCKWGVKELGWEMSGGEGFFFPFVWPMVVLVTLMEGNHSCLDRFKIGED